MNCKVCGEESKNLTDGYCKECAPIENEHAELHGIPITTNGRYMWIDLEHGKIQVKWDDEGIVIDMYDTDGENVASTYAHYSELEGK